MQKVLTAAEMHEVDRLTTEKYGLPSILLMENAAHAVARVITEKLGGSVKGKSILVLCGKGNNGGDGAALARILWTQGAKVEVLIWGTWQETKGDARKNLEILNSIRGQLSLVSIESRDQLSGHWQFVRSERKVDVIVDAVFGTGLTRPLDDDYFAFLDIARDYKLDCHPSTVLAVDIPSGLNADFGGPQSCPLEADVTVTFTAPKPATVLPPSSSECGEVIVAQIGSPMELINNAGSRLFLAEGNDVRSWLWNSRFSEASYKNKRGHAVIIAGSKDYTGAPVMTANAAMRSGVGLTTLCVPESCRAEVASRSLPEVIVRGIGERSPHKMSEDAFSENDDVINQADAIAVGPGLSATEEGVEKLVREIFEKRKVPLIVDAGALWFFNRPSGVPIAIEGQPRLILTPHEGEFMRLLGTDDKDLIKDRVAAVREFAQQHNVILVLKGERVLIGEPGGKVVVNPTGNSGLGKAGNGDTLTGIIAGFAAQANAMKIDIFETVVAAVYIAGLAGDIAEKKYGKRVMTASDVRECFADAFGEFENR